MKKEKNEYSPYCSVCDACGEEGCCSPMSCEQHPDGDFCKTYLKDLRFGYAMNRFFEKEIFPKLSAEWQELYDKEWNEAYDNIYKPKE